MLELSGLVSSIDIHKEYPTAEIFAPCHSDAMLLQNDYASKDGETTAILSYIYQSYIVKNFNKEISLILERIAIQEMKHHETLAGLIVKLGGNPIIADNTRYWYGGYINYNKNLHNMTLCNIKAEETAIENYLLTIDKLKNKTIVPVIQAIIADERHHIAIFNQILSYINVEK